ncbi:phage integrase N-terminal SAM-like domain-containing protein [Clostridium estertheticum]|uniref:phage integrase N-terminal SAM-like domain-containing protein n=1 Tax=Clostridium estertheticum TaxID=238834 RepID=UPI001C0B2DA5|nr:phage integrase N-terminal SAM-like domain-containing protein [Clostridium estertheticum]
MTIKSYINHVSNFAKFYNKSPKYLGEKEICDYLHYCIIKKPLLFHLYYLPINLLCRFQNNCIQL